MDFNREMFDDMIEEASDSDNNSEEQSEEENETASNNKRKIEHNQLSSKKVKYEDISSNDKKKKNKELYKPPTVEELNELKETENLFNNNLFRLQIKELVSEIEIKNKRKKFITNWFEAFRQILNTLTEYDEVLLSNIKPILKKKKKQDKLVDKLATKYEKYLITDQDLSLMFVKPETVEAFGCYENQSLPGPILEYKLNLKIPKSCFHLKDFLNNRYLVKRYYYLLYIAEEICTSDIISSVDLVHHEDNYLLPILNITPEGCDKVTIKVYATPTEDYFKPTRFLPEQNNVKINLFKNDVNIDDLKNTPTLLYNCTLAHDVTLTINSDYIKTVLTDHPNIQEGIKLLGVWIKQREFDIGLGSFTENIILYFVTFLSTKRKINKHMSSYQVIRNFWSFLASTDLYKNPISICEHVSAEQLNSFKEKFDIVLLDKSGCYNVLGFLNYDFYKRVRTECELALKLLDDSRVNSFHSLFLTKLPFHLQYDVLLALQKLPNEISIDDKEKAKTVGYYPLVVVKQITDLMKKGLSKRFTHIVPRLTKISTDGYPEKIMLGVNLDPDNAFNFIELGPALNDHIEAARFKKFWGSLSSNRRFRDGSTKVAVYFKTRTIREKRLIVKKIIDFILGEKLKLDYKLYYDEFEKFIVNKKIITRYPLGTNEESSLKIISLSDEIGKKIRELKMSLSITGVQGVSDVYSYTEVFPPLPTNYTVGEKIGALKENNIIFSNKKIKLVPRYVQVIDCVLQLEHSSKWPNTLEGIRHIKTSFYLEISKLLKASFNLLTHVTKQYLEVFYEGLVFRYRFYVPKEISLIKKEATVDGTICYRESQESFQLNLNLNILPKVTSALKGLQSQHPSYGPGTALIKRWLRAQLIDEYHFPDVVINLVNASLYLMETSFITPNTPQMSFLRFLKFFSESQWDLQSVLVNFNEEISKEEIMDLEAKLQQNRESHQALYIIMPCDNGESVFTKTAPTRCVLNRVKNLAGAALNFYSNKLLEAEDFDVKNLFLPNWEGYNLLIHLSPLLNPRRHEQIEHFDKQKLFIEKYDAKKETKIPIADFNPIQIYLKELRENYGKYASFFHDTYGGNIIGVLWDPKIFESRDFKVSHVNGRKFENEKLVINLDAIIEDFYILGKDLVKSIEKK